VALKHLHTLAAHQNHATFDPPDFSIFELLR